ncbi:MAG: radical SAM protein [Candidatus Omnitrophica bacterium]|nr:radical SAM protein [Candidatus Omnitrophota bacterium]
MSSIAKLPDLLFSDSKGKVYHHSTLKMVVESLGKYSLPKGQEIIAMPKGSTLFYLPGRKPLGFNPQSKKVELLDKFKGQDVFAVAVFPIPAYLRLHLPVVKVISKKCLPLWAYTACGFHRGRFVVSAIRVDKRVRQSPWFYDGKRVKEGVRSFFKRYPKNRLYQHLANCALNYNCLAAKNLFLQRWEAPLPTARSCNAKCLGCLSHQEEGLCASHNRISFMPDRDELVEVMSNHLRVAQEAIVSFGQGCEGEPLLGADSLARAVVEVRKLTSRGTINMNTNASLPNKIKNLCLAGIDSFRVSLNSPDKRFYDLYFKPQGYSFSDVLKSIAIAKRYNKFVSINLFVFPGFSDSTKQIKSLIKLIKNSGIDMIQWRNLNMDPEIYRKIIPTKNVKAQGILYLLKSIKREFPKLKMGYFNLPKEQFKSF